MGFDFWCFRRGDWSGETRECLERRALKVERDAGEVERHTGSGWGVGLGGVSGPHQFDMLVYRNDAYECCVGAGNGAD